MKSGVRHIAPSTFSVIILCAALAALTPFFAHAAADATADPSGKITMSDKANAMCTPWKAECGCNQVLKKTDSGLQCVGSSNTYSCPPGVCYDTDVTGKYKILGVCAAPMKCEAVLAPGLGGAGNVLDAGLQQLGQILGQLLQQLIQGGSGGGGGGGTATTTCPNGYHTVHTPSSDPCARYVPPASNLLNNSSLSTTNGANNLLQALNDGGGAGDSGNGTVSITITNNNTNTNTNTDTNANADSNTSIDVITGGTSSSTNGVTISGAGLPVLLAPVGGTTGDIQFTGNGATVIAGATDAQSNTTIAGFYGSDTFGTQEPQGIAAQMCRNRPWASNFLSVVIPSAFFDSLCTWRGYQVGMPPQTSAPVLQQTPVTQSPGAASTASQKPSIQPKVDIWAVPASVPLATRTTIYWNTQGVTDCTVSSSDGNFNQNSSSGGAATVPLTGSTTFTISCSTSDGSPITDSAIVDIAI